MFERLILASTHQRQSPANVTLFGISNLVMDGIKLFGKLPTELIARQVGAWLICVGLLAALATDLAVHRSPYSAMCEAKVLELLVFAEVLEFATLYFAVTTRNHFIDIALARLLEVGLLAELVVTLGLLVMLMWAVITQPSYAQEGADQLTGIVAICLFVPAWMLAAGKTPFDLVEAESEIIDGLSVDTSGAIFSTFYATEVLILLVTLKLFAFWSLSCWAILPVAGCLLMIFIGRILLNRFLISETIALFLGPGLLLPPLLLVVL